MIAYIAQLYVNVLEPAFKVLLIAAIIAFLLYGFNLLRGGDKKNDLVNGVVNLIVKISLKTIQLIGKGILGFFKMLLKTIRVLMATVRDFLTSKI
jgi:hypothetical protein